MQIELFKLSHSYSRLLCFGGTGITEVPASLSTFHPHQGEFIPINVHFSSWKFEVFVRSDFICRWAYKIVLVCKVRFTVASSFHKFQESDTSMIKSLQPLPMVSCNKNTSVWGSVHRILCIDWGKLFLCSRCPLVRKKNLFYDFLCKETCWKVFYLMA